MTYFVTCLHACVWCASCDYSNRTFSLLSSNLPILSPTFCTSWYPENTSTPPPRSCRFSVTWLIHNMSRYSLTRVNLHPPSAQLQVLCDMTYSCMSRYSMIRVNLHPPPAQLQVLCDMTHSYVCHDFNDTCEPLSLLLRTTEGLYAMIHSCVCHDFIDTCEPPIPLRAAAGSLWHYPYICASWLIHTCDMTHAYVCHDSFVRVDLHLPSAQLQVLCNMTQLYSVVIMGWLRLVGSLKF